MKTIRTTCPYCGVGCGVLASVDDAGQVSVRGDDQHPANLGRLCVKGAALGETTGLAGRLLTPEVDGQQVAWPQALAETAARLRQIIDQHGPQAVAFYASGQLLTEDYYAANKLMKGFIGAANIDTNSRLCMSSAVTGYKRAFGADVVPCSYDDVENSDLVVLVGSNAAWAATSETITSGQAASAWLTAWLSGSDTTGLVPMIQTALTSPRPMAANSSTAVSPGVCASRSVPQKRASRCRSSGTKSMCAASIVASPPTSRPPMALG